MNLYLLRLSPSVDLPRQGPFPLVGLPLAMPPHTNVEFPWPGLLHGPPIPCAFAYNRSFANVNLPCHELALAWILTAPGPSDTSLLWYEFSFAMGQPLPCTIFFFGPSPAVGGP